MRQVILPKNRSRNRHHCDLPRAEDFPDKTLVQGDNCEHWNFVWYGDFIDDAHWSRVRFWNVGKLWRIRYHAPTEVSS